ncbi:MAG: mechanosensitive ion channel [Bacteroidia bacterium]
MGFIPLVAIILWGVAAYLIVVNIFNPPRETLIASLASVGIAVGLAAQDVIKNIFAGLVIIFDDPFKVGDKIEVGSHYGEVTRIGLRSTKITTADDSMVTLPNAEVMNNAVSNSNTGEANCQVVSEIYLPPNIDTVLVRKIAVEAAQVSKFIYLNKPITVLFFNTVQDGVPFYKMRLKAYVSDIRNEFAFKSDMTELVLKELFEEGILDKDYYLNHG